MVTTKFTGADAEKQPAKAWEMRVDAHDELWRWPFSSPSVLCNLSQVFNVHFKWVPSKSVIFIPDLSGTLYSYKQMNNWSPTDAFNSSCSKIQSSFKLPLIFSYSKSQWMKPQTFKWLSLKPQSHSFSPTPSIKWNIKFCRFHLLTVFCKYLTSLSPLRLQSLVPYHLLSGWLQQSNS